MSLVFNNKDYAGDLINFVDAAEAFSADNVITKTYNTPADVIPAATALAVATTASALTSYGYTEAQADSIPVAINALEADVLALRKMVVTLTLALEAVGILG
jgi:hypothetical protein